MILAICALVGIAGVAGSLAMLAQLRHERRVSQRLQGLRGKVARAQPAGAEGTPLLRIVAALGGAVARSGVLSARTIEELEQTLTSSGLRGRQGIGLFIGSKLLLLAGLPVVAFVTLSEFGASSGTTRLVTVIAAVVGLLLPDSIVRRNHKSYLDRVDQGVADTLDMLVICSQAGLGLETALHRVAAEIRLARPEIAGELDATLKEMRISVDNQRALINLGTRTGLLSLKRVTATLAQTLQFGTPLTDALRVLSAEMRQDVLTKFEERAARLPVLLTMPMIIFIFPCIFIVIAGPAAMEIGKAFTH